MQGKEDQASANRGNAGELAKTGQSRHPVVVDAVRIADVLSKLALEVLDAERERTGVDEWDEADIRCYLYDAATAWQENDPSRVLEYER